MRYGFSLIELLVVITIIVILLALLTPALDKAIYQAELAVCGTHLHSISRTAATYAVDYKRRYPDRPNVATGSDYEPYKLTNSGSNRDPQADLRMVIGDYTSMKTFVDPLLNEIDLSVNASPRNTHVYGDYNLWFGYGYHDNRGMLKLGDRWGWNGRSYAHLGGCASEYNLDNQTTRSVHPDAAGTMSPSSLQGERTTNIPGPLAIGPAAYVVFERYALGGSLRRGPIDVNFVGSDGAVARYDRFEYFEGDPGPMVDQKGRFDRVAGLSGGPGSAFGTWWISVPKR